MAQTRETAPWIDLISSARVYDLGQSLEPNIPGSPNQPGFRMALLRRHGDWVRPDGVSGSTELITLSGHAGTHIDALSHIARNGKLYGGIDAQQAQAGGRFKVHGIESVPPLFCRGVLLDVARHKGVEALPPAQPITADLLREVATAEGVELPAGGAVLIRAGWARYWSSPPAYLNVPEGAPGVDASGAELIASAQVRVTGTDTLAYERLAPGAGLSMLPIHGILLVEYGVHIMESLDLEELAGDRVFEFLFVCLPLKMVGATGSPVRPIAAAFS